MKKSLVFAAAAFTALVLAAGALASGGSILDGYGGEAGPLANKVSTKAPASAQGTLPFTGLDLGLAVGGAMLLLGTGAMLRRVGRKKT